MTLDEVLDEFISVVDDIYGLYLDATHGFVQLKVDMERRQNEFETKKGMTVAEQNEKPIKYVANAAEGPTLYTLHHCTQLEFKNRNSRNNINFFKQANLCLAVIYSYWEDHYREAIGKSIDVPKEQIQSDLMGDLRLIRISIIHNRSIAISDVIKCKKLTGLQSGKEIQINEYDFENIITLIKEQIETIRIKFNTK